MFEYLVLVNPLGMMYGSAGAFLSPENLVGRSGAKFPPDAATLAGLFFSTDRYKSKSAKLKRDFYVAGPFWGKRKKTNQPPDGIYVPIPRNLIIGESQRSQWKLKERDGKLEWHREKKHEEIESDFSWQLVSTWMHQSKSPDKKLKAISEEAEKTPWQYNPILHPRLQEDQRVTLEKNGLFLENAVQMNPETCLVYLSTHELEKDWYRFGGENHLVEIDCVPLKGAFKKLLEQKIERTFALITPGVWGSGRLSYRYPQAWEKEPLMLTEKPVPYRYYIGGKLGRGRYAVPAGSVYVLDEPLNKAWWDWDEAWFPKEGIVENDGTNKGDGPLTTKHFGSGLCLPIDIVISNKNETIW